MQPLNTQQRRDLEYAAQLGLLSPALLDEAQWWGRRRHEPMPLDQWVPLQARYTERLNTAKLAQSIYEREVEMLLEEEETPAREQKIAEKQLRVRGCETQVKALMMEAGRYQPAAPASLRTLEPTEPPLNTEQSAHRETVLRAIELAAAVQTMIKQVANQTTNPKQSPPAGLRMIDAVLCMRWFDLRVNDAPSTPFWPQTERLNRYLRCLAYSARAAELSAQAYYQALGLSTEDVSLQQLENENDEWVNFDIRAGERCVDVKNARHALNGPGHFVEHCVPRFKQDRISMQDVVILGVLSDYLAEPQAYIDMPHSVCILGEVTAKDLRSVQSWCAQRFGPAMDLRGLWKPQYVAGWLFEYPVEHYTQRLSAMAALPNLLRQLQDAGGDLTKLPAWMLVLCADGEYIRRLSLSPRRRRILDELQSLDAEVGLTRRSLYALALGLTIEALARKEAPREDLAELLELTQITSPDGQQLTLLGLQDLQGYVTHLIDNLMAIGDQVLERGIQLTGFLLSHPAILRGVEASGRTVTLIAYCGGWQTEPFRARCGKSPLTLAQHVHCPDCDHLVCDHCGHCSNLCQSCQNRQDDVVRWILEDLSGIGSPDGSDDVFYADDHPLVTGDIDVGLDEVF